jgi:hypothetical protein
MEKGRVDAFVLHIEVENRLPRMVEYLTKKRTWHEDEEPMKSYKS